MCCHLVNYLWRWVPAQETCHSSTASPHHIFINPTPPPSPPIFAGRQKGGIRLCSSALSVHCAKLQIWTVACPVTGVAFHVFICKWGADSVWASCLLVAATHQKQTLSLAATLFIPGQILYALFRDFLQKVSSFFFFFLTNGDRQSQSSMSSYFIQKAGYAYRASTAFYSYLKLYFKNQFALFWFLFFLFIFPK